MNQNIITRSYCDSDEKALADIIRKTWHYDDFGSPEAASRMAAVFLYSCLTSQTYTQVAELNGQPVGVIMAQNIQKHRCPFKYRLKLIQSILSLCRSKEGRTIIRTFKNISQIDRELLKNSGKDYPGEVSFFAVHDDCRGLGVGKLLFQNMLTYMKQEQIQDFYLFTDTTCNFGFYEHQGMKRRQEKKAAFSINGLNYNIIFFLYDYCNQ